jgi:putative heme-binding domain-containing protein
LLVHPSRVKRAIGHDAKPPDDRGLGWQIALGENPDCRVPSTMKVLLPFSILSVALGVSLLPAADTPTGPAIPPAAPVFTVWQVDPLAPVVNKSLGSGRSFERGKALFAALACAQCHSFGGGENVGGIGPDLTGVGGRYGVRDILDSIINPSTNISNLYGTWIIETRAGKQLTGKVMAEDDDEVSLAENVFDLTKVTKLKRSDIVSIEESSVSLMPPGLINAISESEIADLIAYLISGGDASNRMFRAAPPAPAK